MICICRLLADVTGRWLIIAVLCAPNLCFSAGEQQFGRLFTTQEERQRLQELREENRQIARGRDHAGSGTHGMTGSDHTRQTQTALSRRSEVSEEELPVITLRGLIYKKDKAGMAWINAQEGEAALDYRKLEAGQILDNEVTIRVPMTGKSVKLKPGQSYHLHSGAVTDLKDDAP